MKFETIVADVLKKDDESAAIYSQINELETKRMDVQDEVQHLRNKILEMAVANQQFKIGDRVSFTSKEKAPRSRKYIDVPQQGLIVNFRIYMGFEFNENTKLEEVQLVAVVDVDGKGIGNNRMRSIPLSLLTPIKKEKAV